MVPRTQLPLAPSGLITSRGAKRPWNIQNAEQISSPWLSVSRRSSVTRKAELLLEDQFFTWRSWKSLKPSPDKKRTFSHKYLLLYRGNSWWLQGCCSFEIFWNVLLGFFFVYHTKMLNDPLTTTRHLFWKSETCDLTVLSHNTMTCTQFGAHYLTSRVKSCCIRDRFCQNMLELSIYKGWMWIISQYNKM